MLPWSLIYYKSWESLMKGQLRYTQPQRKKETGAKPSRKLRQKLMDQSGIAPPAGSNTRVPPRTTMYPTTN